MAIDPFANCNYDILGWQCTLETCCLAQSSFYYLPNLGGNVFFALFSACSCSLRRTWGGSTRHGATPPA